MDPFGLEGRLTSEVRDIKGTCHLLCLDLARKEVKEERTDLIESQLFGFASWHLREKRPGSKLARA